MNYDSIVRVAAVQAEPEWYDIEASVDKAIGLIEEAGRGGAELVAFPEVFISGYPWHLWLGSPGWGVGRFGKRFHASAMAVDGPQIARIRDAARVAGTAVVMGYSERAAGSVYMSQAFIGADGELIANRRKLKPTHVERSLYGEGDGSGFGVHPIGSALVGGLNCWEHYQPLSKYAMYSLHEQIHVASWPSMSMASDYYIHSAKASEEAVRMYAMEGQTFVLASTQIVTEKAHEFFCEDEEQVAVLGHGGGFSRIIGPDGSDLVPPPAPDAETVLFADLDLSAITLAKTFADPVGHYSRPDVLSLRINHAANKVTVSTGGDAEPVATPEVCEVVPSEDDVVGVSGQSPA
ncbi:carbon-nitrogen hydrolase family protein [Microbacterium aquimaris]|uniref:carbon-nitrogen hydrolase family protein n=1 Tax=Microbacterium aquimaris TaxID=459816 RepID=UPI002AD3AB49|nr:carbon-nitrogen hydrolase family protein [Microbacterium aquimaris]MDZ8274830.1 carbon-nitrogen hydrolase family protein [Microbacterium aquimaris]